MTIEASKELETYALSRREAFPRFETNKNSLLSEKMYRNASERSRSLVSLDSSKIEGFKRLGFKRSNS